MANSVHIRNRKGRLYIETYIFGRQTRRTLGLTLTGDRVQDRKVLKLAEIIRSRREMQIACCEWGIPDIQDGDKLLTTYIEENYHKSKNYTLGRCLHYIKRYRKGGVRLSEVTPQWVMDFQSYLKDECELSQGSASLYSSAFRRQLSLAVRDKMIVSNPAQFVKNIPMPESKKQPLGIHELKKLADIEIRGKLGSEVRRAFFFSCYTGLRVSDLRELRWGMLITRADGKTWICKQQKKTGKIVEIPLHENALLLAGSGGGEGRGNDGDFVFPLLATTRTNTDQYLRKWGLAAGIEKVSWHTARHTMATLALENGAEIRTVSELLGHTDISTTLRYAKATDSLKVSAIERMPALE